MSSRKLIIAVDCDDVILPSTKYVIDEYNNRYGTNVCLADSHTAGLDSWGVSDAETLRRFEVIQTSDKYVRYQKPFPDAINVLKRLSKDHKLYMVTARAPGVIPATQAMVDRYLPGVFESLEHIGSGVGKGAVCRTLKADVFIDDKLSHLVHASDHGVKHCIWFGDYAWQNKDVEKSQIKDLGDRAGHWLEVEEMIERYATI